MRILITMVVLLAAACSGDSPAHVDSGRTCNGTLYDTCGQEHDCMGMDCRTFQSDGFEVCTKTCTIGDDASCGMTLDGRHATCNAMGVCKPPGPNDCIYLQ